MEDYGDIKEVQALCLNVLQTFISVCEKYRLRYYIGCGSLIGVLRHGGYIPWDDDIDVLMPRPDYDRFVRIIKKKMPEGYGICDRYTNPEWHFALCQFYDAESEIEVHLAEEARRSHIGIDIFPLDGLPSGKALNKRLNQIMACRYLVQIAHVKTQVDTHRDRPLKEKLVLGFCRAVPVGKLINSDMILDRLEGFLRSTNFDEAEYAGNMLGRGRKKEALPRAWWGTPTDALFEGIPVKIPEKSHEVLTALYGDYMKIPPVEKRESHHVTILKRRSL